jgi:hypothetical protein
MRALLTAFIITLATLATTLPAAAPAVACGNINACE